MEQHTDQDQSLGTRDLTSSHTARADTPAVEASAPPKEKPESAQNGGETLLATELSSDFEGRWEGIQSRFVDEPRRAVEDADNLVATVMQKLAEGFAHERERLEAHWDRGEDVSTEDLRVTLQRYRSFFERLLTAA
jgi:hypothetical protein